MTRPNITQELQDYWDCFVDKRFTRADLWREFGFKFATAFPPKTLVEDLAIAEKDWIEPSKGPRGGEGWKLTDAAIAKLQAAEAKEQKDRSAVAAVIASVKPNLGNLQHWRDSKRSEIHWSYYPPLPVQGPCPGGRKRDPTGPFVFAVPSKTSAETVTARVCEAEAHVGLMALHEKQRLLAQVAMLDQVILQATQSNNTGGTMSLNQSLLVHLEKAVAGGYEHVILDGFNLPDGFAIIKKGEQHFGLRHDGQMSMPLKGTSRPLGWITQQVYQGSDKYPAVGEVWDYEGHAAIISGNSIAEDGSIWVMEAELGIRAQAYVVNLEPRKDRKSLDEAALIERFSSWARQGSPDAMWWLGWWFEGTNHSKSTWYYIAALRADPKGHGWARERIIDDARSACMCAGVPDPDLGFLSAIPEIQGKPIGSDWTEAVKQAELAVHVSAVKVRENNGRGILIDHKAPKASGSTQ